MPEQATSKTKGQGHGMATFFVIIWVPIPLSSDVVLRVSVVWADMQGKKLTMADSFILVLPGTPGNHKYLGGGGPTSMDWLACFLGVPRSAVWLHELKETTLSVSLDRSVNLVPCPTDILHIVASSSVATLTVLLFLKSLHR